MKQGTILLLKPNTSLYDVGGNSYRATSERLPEERAILWKPQALSMPLTGILSYLVVTDLEYFDKLARGGYQPPPLAYVATTDAREESPEERKAAIEAERAKERAGKEALALAKKQKERPFITNVLDLPLPSSSGTSTQGMFDPVAEASQSLHGKTKLALGLTLGATALLALYNPKHIVEILTAGAALSAVSLYIDSET